MKFIKSIFILSIIFPLITIGASNGKKERRKHTVLYKLKDNVDESSQNNLEKIIRKYKLIDNKRKLGKNVKQVTAKINPKKSEEDLSNEILSSGAVDYAEPDYLIEPSLAPNDPYYGNQWHLRTINAPVAWDTVVGNSAVKVAVCDTGINSSHPDLKDLLLLPGKNLVDGSTNTEPVHSHGTKVAGTMSAHGNNGIGVSGVTWNVRIIPGKISNLDNGAAYFSDMAECITYAADNGAKVVNLSYQGFKSSSVDSAASYLKQRGGLVFIAAGNDGSDISSYGDSKNSIIVGSTTSSNIKASSSSYGTPIDLVAPGSSIYATSLTGYGSWSGTSAASPVAAGAAALLFAHNANYSPDQVEAALFNTTKDLGLAGDDNTYGKGLVDVGAALSYLQGQQTNTPPQALINADQIQGTVPLTVNFDGLDSNDPDGTIVSYEWTFPGSVKKYGDSASYTFNDVGVHTVTLKVTDDSGSIDEDSILITVNADVNISTHVNDILLSQSYHKKHGYQVTASVRVFNNYNQPVANAIVYGDFSGAINMSNVYAVTDSTGHANFASSRTKETGTVVFTVSDIVQNGSSNYDSTQNVESSDSITLSTSSGGGTGGGSNGKGKNR